MRVYLCSVMLLLAATFAATIEAVPVEGEMGVMMLEDDPTQAELQAAAQEEDMGALYTGPMVDDDEGVRQKRHHRYGGRGYGGYGYRGGYGGGYGGYGHGYGGYRGGYGYGGYGGYGGYRRGGYY